MTKRKFFVLSLLLTILAFLRLWSYSQSEPNSEFKSILSWLSPDTESIIVANDFTISIPSEPDSEDDFEFLDAFQKLVLGIFWLNEGKGIESLYGKRVEIAIVGARNFRSPKGLGVSPYDGCHVILLAEDMTKSKRVIYESLKEDSSGTQTLNGEEILIFKDLFEEDDWTFYLTWFEPRLIFFATNLEYLSQVLDRKREGGKDRAFPDSLIEWRYVDITAPVWALRHFATEGYENDPTSPFVGGRGGGPALPGAVGYVLNLKEDGNSFGKSYMLSREADPLKKIMKDINDEMWTGKMHYEIREVEDDLVVCETTYLPFSDGHDKVMTLVLMSWNLGHGIFL